MGAVIVPVKTAEGQAELGTRQLRLSQRHRTVLLLVDGRRTETEVRQLAAQAGVAAHCFDELVGLGLIATIERATAEAPRTPPLSAPGAEPIAAVALTQASASADTLADDSLLPASGTLPPDSTTVDSVHGGLSRTDSWLPPEAFDDVDADAVDSAFAQARDTLVRMVRSEAPVAGSLTLLRLRRARSRADLNELLAEVEARIGRRNRSLVASQTLRSVRHLLTHHADSTRPAG